MIWVVLPAYNEEDNLGELLRSIRHALDVSTRYRVLVIDDGSTDRTAAVAAREHPRMPVHTISHGHNRGLAQAIRTGLAAVTKDAAEEDVLVIMDADNTHPPELIPRLIDALDGGADVAIASRFRRGSQVFGVPLMRRILSRGAALVFRGLFPIRGVRDYTCGYRAYRVGILQRAMQEYGDDLIQSSGFSVMTELLLRLRPLGPAVSEVPLILRYDRKRGKSKLVPGSTILQYLTLIQGEFSRLAAKKRLTRGLDP